MKGPLVAALAAATFAAIAFGGIATAAESGDPSEPQPVVGTTIEAPEESDGETPDDAAPSDSGADPTSAGLTCLPGPVEDGTGISCTGTGNERSAEVALVPRTLAHSDTAAGPDRGSQVSAWAKTRANTKSDGDSDAPAEPAGAAEDSADEPVPAPPGRSAQAPGQSGADHGRHD